MEEIRLVLFSLLLGEAYTISSKVINKFDVMLVEYKVIIRGKRD